MAIYPQNSQRAASSPLKRGNVVVEIVEGGKLMIKKVEE